MNGLDSWDTALLAGAAIAATWKLVTLMRLRRNRLVAEVQQQIDQQQEAARKAAKAKEAA